ncbi:GntR family transcriptional regulator [Frondihabitans sucicola]|uniref:GntR family transcriptional regulator n=1 Tax=Frondihabitans sucicola TaxID=1268041 RepID=UPI0025745351|nr:GntR family transcriptional regulator [Frondihabitans sucicola]
MPSVAARSKSRELLSDSVRRRLLGSILDGTLVAGERLHDEQLVAWLGVSRTPIRTALERLAEIGLIEMEPNRFTRVAVPSLAGLVQALEVHAALTVSAVEGVVSRLDDAAVVEFRRRLAPVVELGREHGPACWQPDDLASVDRVLCFFSQRAGNPLLLDLLHEVRVRLAFCFVNTPVPVDRSLVTGFAVEILRGVERRDESAVVRAVVSHLGAAAVAGAPGGAGLVDAKGVGPDG